MTLLEVDIAEVDDSQFPALALCVFTDAYGKMWHVKEKLPVIVSDDKGGSIPATGWIAGAVISRHGDVVCFDTKYPWGITSIDGVSRFDVVASTLTYLDEDIP